MYTQCSFQDINPQVSKICHQDFYPQTISNILAHFSTQLSCTKMQFKMYETKRSFGI